MLAIKILGAIAAVVVVAAVTAGLAMYFRLIPIPGPILALLIGAKPPEYSARYFPPDTIAYAWVTLAPRGGQLDDMQAIWARFNEFRDFRRLIDEAQDGFEDETGIDLEREVMPWIGPDASAAFIDFNFRREELIVAATIGVRDQDAARDFLDEWLEYMEDSEGADFDRDSYKDFDIWADESAYQVYGLSKDALVFSTTASGLEEVIDGIAGDLDRSLADNENFQAAREALPHRRFASFYVDYQEGIELVEEFYSDEFSTVGIWAFGEQEPEWIAGASAWVERGIVVETVSPAVAGFGLETSELENPADLLPNDTIGFMAAAFDPNVDNWRKALAEYRLLDVLPYPELLDEINAGLEQMTPGSGPALSDNATLADALNVGFDIVRDATGIDLETDLFDHLGGAAMLAVREFDFDDAGDDPAVNAIDAVAMLSYREEGKDKLAGTMDDVTGLLQDNIGMEANSVDVGADEDATIFGLDFLGMMGEEVGYQPGYVLHRQYLTIGTTEDALTAIVSRQNGEGENLTSDAEYRRAVGHLAEGRQFLGYVDGRRIIEQLDRDDLNLDPGEYRLLRESIGVLAFGSATDEDYSRGVAALTLFPE